MFQPSASITETTTSAPIAAMKVAKAAKRKSAKPVQHFGLLPTEFEGPNDMDGMRATFLAVSAALRPLVENRRLSRTGLLDRAQRQIRSMKLSMKALYEMASSMWHQCWGRHASSDPVAREIGALAYQASLLIAARTITRDLREAHQRLDFVSRSFGDLPIEARKGARQRMIRDLTAMLEGDRKVLPRPANTQDLVPHDTRLHVPPYYLGKRFKRGDDLLLSSRGFTGYVPKPKLVVGASYALHPYGGSGSWEAPGYEGTPPHWLIGRIVRVTRGHWFLKTPAPYNYVWRLPRRGWGVSGRVIGYRSGDNFFRLER